MIEKYTNEYGKECYEGVKWNTKLSDLEFHEVKGNVEDHFQWALHTNLGSITVVRRFTGFGWWDTETGYRSRSKKFWLASVNFDIRKEDVVTFREAVKLIKEFANTCKGK